MNMKGDSMTEGINQRFPTWKEHCEAVKNGTITFNLNDPVIEFEEGTREMSVSFNPKLVIICEEAGHIAALGGEIPAQVQDLVVSASKLLIPAKALNEIARFHNTVGESMIRSQRPMMLESAVALSKVVKDQQSVSWEDKAEVKVFLRKMMDIVDALGGQNEYLSQTHRTVMGKIHELYSADLIRHHKKWKDNVRAVTDLVEKISSEGFKNVKSWQAHIDHQLYKVLDTKYRQTLLSISQTLPEIKVDVILSNDLVSLKPAVEDLRVLYRANVKKVASIPNKFQGVAASGEFFGSISNSRFAQSIQKVLIVREARLFSKLEKTQKKYLRWVVKEGGNGAGDASLSPGEWETEFRTAKERGQDFSALTFSDEKVGCFSVGYQSLKMGIEMSHRGHWDGLTRRLMRHIGDEMQGIKQFLSKATITLNTNPESYEDITSVGIRRARLQEEMGPWKVKLEGLTKKNEVLTTWTKTSFDLEEVSGLWDEFQVLFDEQESKLGRQMENVKMNLITDAQALLVEMDNFKLVWDSRKPKEPDMLNDTERLDGVIKYLHEAQLSWHSLTERKTTITSTCQSLGVPPLDFPIASEVEEDLAKYEHIWGKLSVYRREMAKLEEEDWIIFRAKPHTFEEFLDTWDAKLRAAEKSDFMVAMIKEVDELKALIPVLKLIRTDIFTDVHWVELSNLVGIPKKKMGELKMKDLFKARTSVLAKVKELKDLNLRATGEIAVRQALNELDAWEVDASFLMVQHSDSHGRAVGIVDSKDQVSKIGDNQSLVQSIRTSSFSSQFLDRILIWESKLSELEECIGNLNKVQRRWIYLEPIFSHGVLESEQARFRRIDDDFRSILNELGRDARLSSFLRQGGIRGRLSTLVEQLARCQTSLNELLESKRSIFPRFYFIGDDDLLEIIGQSTNPTVIQSHLKKLFGGIHSVDFSDNQMSITAMNSLEGEKVGLKNPVGVSSKVEEWLNELKVEMTLTLKSMVLDCVSDSKKSTCNPAKYPSQVLCLSSAIIFTDQCEEAIRSQALDAFLGQLRESLDTYTGQRMKLGGDSGILELKLKDLILDIIHQIEVVESLKNVTNVGDWTWQKQLRSYIRGEDGTVLIKMADAEFLYSYEYLGNGAKLVHTSLTDKCYLTLTQGMKMGLGGNPYGPAGTGKTESVKSLGTLLGRQVLVFNCDEGIDVKSMGRIFTGLVKCGAWGCFDEFNRLDAITLSAISVQIQAIQTSLKEGYPTVLLLDKSVPVDRNSGIFVTLNPAGKGYGARNQLPDNLKQLFRPILMSVPNSVTIAEVILYTEGFKAAGGLGKKLVELFDNCRKLLSYQPHYDWGLRALRTVLRGCGSSLKENSGEGHLSESEECNLVVAAVRLNTLPKLTHSDCMRFDTLVKDVFPQATFREIGQSQLVESLKVACKGMGLEQCENQIKKCLELYEQLRQRMGVVLVGPSNCGKSSVISLLQAAMGDMGVKVKSHLVNPKALPKTKLLGHINTDTRQWIDGVLTIKAQEVYAEPPEVQSWLIFDGDIDPEWIESLNSVLDDNRLLTMPSGWRIKLGPNVNFIFETHHISLASPATISRLGVIFMSDEDLDVDCLVKAFKGDVVQPFLESHLAPTLEKVAGLTAVLPLSDNSLALNVLSQMGGVRTDEEFAEALAKGVGGHLDVGQAVKLREDVMMAAKISQNGWSLFSKFNRSSGGFEPFVDELLSEGTVFEEDKLPLVRTMDVQRVLDHIKPWLKNGDPFLVVGPEGCGKTIILQAAFTSCPSVDLSSIHCSSMTSPENVLQVLSQKCVTITNSSSGKVYKPKNSSRLILFFKDLNMVKPDKWGSVQLVEFLRQVVTAKGYYNEALEWITLDGIQIVICISAGEGGGRYPLSPRLTSKLRVCTMSETSESQLLTIYQSYLRCTLPSHPQTRNVANAMVRIFTEVKKAYTPLSQGHYIFTPRDLTKWTLGLLRYSQEGSPETFYTDWGFEACRVFADKLVSEEEKRKFINEILIPGASQFGIHALKESSRVDQLRMSALATGSTTGATDLQQISYEDASTLVKKAILRFNREEKRFSCVVTKELLETVTRVDKILSRPSSSLLLAGTGGVGRHAATYIVSVLHHATVLTPKISRHYGSREFKNDLKSALHSSAIEGNKVFLIVEDFQLVESSFLDTINALLSSGDITGLYAKEELEAVMNTLRDLASSEGFLASSLHGYFLHRIRSHLHIILIMDTRDDRFIQNYQANPALYKTCSMLWMGAWSRETMAELPVSIGRSLMPSEMEEPHPDPSAFTKIHFSVLSSYPKKYTTLILTYYSLWSQRKASFAGDINKLLAGIGKLEEATEIVKTLRSEATAQEAILADKEGEANTTMEMISTTLKSSNVQKDELEELRRKTEVEKNVLAEKKAVIEDELAETEPLIQSARAAVGSIRNESLTEIRSLRAPPDIIRDVLEGVLRLMGVKDMSWNSMKMFLAKRGVKEEIKNFDARNIDPGDRDAVERMLQVKEASFDPKNAKRASAAAEPLVQWVLANVKFAKVLEKIGPLEKQKKRLEDNLRMAEGNMDEISKGLTSVDEKVKALTEKFKATSSEALSIKFNLDKVQGTLAAAEKLVERLQDEYTRWQSQLRDLQDESVLLPSCSLLSAAFLTYLPNESEDVRAKTLEKWKVDLDLPDFSIQKFLGSDRQFLKWRSLGLPSDQLCVENAIAITQITEGESDSFLPKPYVIDPSNRAVEWLVNQMSSERLVVTNLQDPKFPGELELAVRFGKVVIVTEVDTIHPMLVPLLRGDVSYSGGSRELVSIGGREVDYNPSFRIFLTTRSPNPVVSPDAKACLTMVNFTTTLAGLSSQLLTVTLSSEHPDLSSRHEELIKTVDGLQLRMSELEASLLKELSCAEGNILENADLLNSLSKTKSSAQEIQTSLTQAAEIETTITSEIEGFRPLADFGSRVFFVVKQVCNLNVLYQFGIDSFVRLFKKCLEERSLFGKEDAEKRIGKLQSLLVDAVLNYVSRALYKFDQLAFMLHVKNSLQSEPKGSFPQPSLAQIAAESSSKEPILLLVTPGSDPSQGIRDIASSSVGSDKFFEISMGQGEVEEAFAKLKNSSQVGHWVCLKNLHLVTHLLDRLEKEIRTNEPHPSFRLWLTTETHPNFPEVLAMSCLKVAYEVPTGLKKNLLRTCTGWSPGFFEGHPRKNVARSQTLFMLASLHAVIQERRAYLPQGWTLPYEFNDGDLRVGAEVVDRIFRSNRDVSWKYIRGIFENVVYGAKLDNTYDSRILISYLKEYFKDEGTSSKVTFGGKVFSLPASSSLDEYLESVVDQMPEKDVPSFFGLPDNIENVHQKKVRDLVSKKLGILSRSASTSVAGGVEVEVWSKELTPLMILWKKLAQSSDIHPLYQKRLQSPKFEKVASPIQSFIEIEHFEAFRLIQKIHKALGGISRVIRGQAIPSEGVISTVTALIQHEVPSQWQADWDFSSDPKVYISSLVHKATQINSRWIPNARSSGFLTEGVFLSDLLHPERFLCAFKQQCARLNGVSMEELVLVTAWDKGSMSGNSNYCVLKGMMLEGATFRSGRLEESIADDSPVSEFPDSFVAWMPKTNMRDSRKQTLSIPLYANESRTILVAALDLPFSGSDAKWIKAGVALYLK